MTALHHEKGDGGAPRSHRPRPHAIGAAGLSAFLSHLARRSLSTWRTTFISGVISPTLFLLAIGAGLGSLVTDDAGLGTTDYLSFVGPGLLATAAMQQAGQQSLWPTLGALKWEGNYQAALLTPLTTAELATGHLLWIATRVLFSSTLFVLVLAAFGVTTSLLAVLAPLAACATGMAFAAPMSAFAATRQHDGSFSVLARALLFFFLFSGAFFPVDQLPGVLPTAAKLTPIWHGVELCRNLCQGGTSIDDIGHAVYIASWTVVGWLMALRTFRDRLAP